MKNIYKKAIAASIILSLFFGPPAYQYFVTSWTPYYQEKLYKEPRPLLVKALSLQEASTQTKKALDLGAGAGNDTAFLLHNGCNVWANDKEQAALDIISARTDIQEHLNHLVLLPGRFTDLPWETLPTFDMIYAGYSVFFAHPNEFSRLWLTIEKSLAADGLFVGHFLAADHGGFNWWQKRNMTFFTKEELLYLLRNFTIELLEESNALNDKGVRDHSFDVIARKK